MELYRKLTALFAELGPLVSVLIVVLGTALGLAVAGAVVVWLPADHFVERTDRRRSRALRIALRLGRNLIGWPVLALGLVLSLPMVPGPGALCVLIGLSLVDFPGKRRLQQRLLRQPAVRRTIDGLRSRFGRPPFRLDPAAVPGEVAPPAGVSD